MIKFRREKVNVSYFRAIFGHCFLTGFRIEISKNNATDDKILTKFI